MLLVDSFMFFNELDLLEYRFSILAHVVDYFVIVESKMTVQGEPKPLYFDLNKERYSKYLDKVVHVIVDELPLTYEEVDKEGKDVFINEAFQRNCIDRGIEKLNLSPEDLIMISDADEFPNVKLIETLKNIGLDDLYCLLQDYYMFNLNYRISEAWYYYKILPYYTYCTKYNREPQRCREIQNYQKDCNYLTKGGWHFSYFGDTETNWQKITSFSLGNSLRKEMTKDELKIHLDLGIGIYNKHKMDFLPLSENKNLPPNVELLQKFFPCK